MTGSDQPTSPEGTASSNTGDDSLLPHQSAEEAVDELANRINQLAAQGDAESEAELAAIIEQFQQNSGSVETELLRKKFDAQVARQLDEMLGVNAETENSPAAVANAEPDNDTDGGGADDTKSDSAGANSKADREKNANGNDAAGDSPAVVDEVDDDQAEETTSNGPDEVESAADAAPSADCSSGGSRSAFAAFADELRQHESADEQSDDELAAMLDGEFQPVEAVLDDVFTEKAAIVQTDEHSAAEIRTEQCASVAADEPENVNDAQPAGQDDPEQEDADRTSSDMAGIDGDADHTDDSEEQAQDEASPESVPADPAADGSEAAVDDAAIASPDIDESHEQVDDEPTSEPQAQADDDPQLSEPQQTDDRVAEPPPPQDEHAAELPAATDATSIDEPDAEPEAEQPVDEQELAEAAPMQAQQPSAVAVWIRRIDNVVRNMLALINFPLRFVPSSLKPAVNLIALTSLLWVPIVWAFVWLMK